MMRLQELCQILHCKRELKEFFSVEFSVPGLLALWAHQDIYKVQSARMITAFSDRVWDDSGEDSVLDEESELRPDADVA